MKLKLKINGEWINLPLIDGKFIFDKNNPISIYEYTKLSKIKTKKDGEWINTPWE